MGVIAPEMWRKLRKLREPMPLFQAFIEEEPQTPLRA
jgi:hypothetical protein